MVTEEKVHALKDKLRESVKIIVESDDYTVDAADEAMDALSALKDLKCTTSLSRNLDDAAVPPHFRCPLSGNLMTDPVILASGQNFDRTFIQRWLNEVRRICPKTQQVLSHSILTPNCFLQNMISLWCKEHGVELPKPVWDIHGEKLAEDHRLHMRSLLYKLSLSVSEQKEAAKELRQLTKRIPTFRTLFGDSEVIQLMLRPLSPGTASVDPELHEDLITTLLNLSIHDNNKRVLAEDEKVISLLIESLKYSGTVETRSNAAAAIFSMSAIDANRHIIGKSGVIKYLVDLLEEGHPPAMRDAASALFKLCYTHENKGRTVREGAVQVILGKIVDHVLVDELLALLALLSSHHMAVEALVNHGAVPFLLDILREKENTSEERIKENCVVILCTICFNDREKRREIGEDEMVNGTLYELAQRGNSRAQRKARAILESLHVPQSSTS
ncbi:hypothetical protein AAZX31_20G206800 [Glycine max]|nr:hypothetical protein JHK86_056964 [Glycine max]